MASVIHTRGKIEGVFTPLYLDIISDIFTEFCRATLTKRQMVFASTPQPPPGGFAFFAPTTQDPTRKGSQNHHLFPLYCSSPLGGLRGLFKKHNLLFAYRDAVTL
jgi:hypothetical protein